MKNKPFLFISLILIAFIVITSYTPKAAQAEMSMQEDPVSDINDFSHPDKGEDPVADDSIIFSETEGSDFLEEDPSKLVTDNQINANAWGYFNAVGINFVPFTSELTWYYGLRGCLGSSYSGHVKKQFSIPVNVPYNAQGKYIHLTYWNRRTSPDNGPIMVKLYRRYYNSSDIELVKGFSLENSTAGYRYDFFSLSDHYFNTSYWFYYLEITLPPGEATREFCGVQISYINPPLFPVAIPIVEK
ncbi:MAG: hypothetical protein ACOYKC_00450 [Anaerolineaceae bacterium]|jgi:hypothetical protein